MSWIPRSAAVHAALLTTLGALLVFGAFPLPLAGPLVGMALVVLAILVFTRTLDAPAWLGITLLVLAVLMLVDNPASRLLDRTLLANLHALAGAFLIALGVLKMATPDCLPDEEFEHAGRAAAGAAASDAA